MEIPVEITSHMEDKPADIQADSQVTEVDTGNASKETKPEVSNLESEYLDQLRRLKAEFDNYRKRTDREKEEFYAYAKGRVIQNMLPILDDMDRIFKYSKSQEDHLTTGIELIYQKMRAILLNEGLEEIDPVGKPFDPVVHEALGVVDTESEKDGFVMEELERGYLLQGKLLRPSRVRVGRHQEN
jgi:molecular chaperone GrpE